MDSEDRLVAAIETRAEFPNQVEYGQPLVRRPRALQILLQHRADLRRLPVHSGWPRHQETTSKVFERFKRLVKVTCERPLCHVSGENMRVGQDRKSTRLNSSHLGI